MPILQCLSEIRDVNQALSLYTAIYSSWKKGDTHAFPFRASHLSVLMKTLQTKKSYKKGMEIYNEVLAHPENFAPGVASDAVLCNSVIKLLTYSMPQSSSSDSQMSGKSGDLLHYAIEIFNKLLQGGTVPHQSTYGLLISMAGKAGRLDVAEMVLNDMTASGMEPTVITTTSLMTAALDNKNYVMVLDLYQKLLERGQDLDEKTVSVVLDACNAVGLKSEGLKIYTDWCQRGGASTVRVCMSAFSLVNGTTTAAESLSQQSYSQSYSQNSISDGAFRDLKATALRFIFRTVFDNPHHFRKNRNDKTFSYVNEKYIPAELICGFAAQLAIEGRTDELLSAMILQSDFQNKVHQRGDSSRKASALEEIHAIVWCALFDSMPKVGTWRDVMAGMERMRSHFSLWTMPSLQIDVLSSCSASLLICGVMSKKETHVVDCWQKNPSLLHFTNTSSPTTLHELFEAINKKVLQNAPSDAVQSSIALIEDLKRGLI